MAKAECGKLAGVPNCLNSPVFSISAPYMLYTTMNFMACDLSNAKAAHSVFVPFKNDEYTATWNKNDDLLAIAVVKGDEMTKKAGMGTFLKFGK